MKCPADHPELADFMLSALGHVCEEYGMPYFISGGTCLGLYRNGTYIPDDCDLDAAIVHTQTRWNELPLLLYSWGLITDSHGEFENHHYWKDDMLLDITWVKPTGFYAAREFIHGYPVPSPVEEYLAWKYGDTWETPLKEGQYALQHEH